MFSSVIRKICTSLSEDPVCRGISVLQKNLQQSLLHAVQYVLEADEIVIVTGFYIPSAQTIETDGLCGSLFLASACEQMQKRVTILTDPHCHTILSAVCALHFPNIHCFCPNFVEHSNSWINWKKRTTCIAVERPGRSKDGVYRTMRGKIVPAYPLDSIFLLKSDCRHTISCADGLNEIGMGCQQSGIIEKDALIHSVVPVDALLVAGTADWAAFGLLAYLSSIVQKDFLPYQKKYLDVLRSCSSLGVVDGITGKSEMTVDTLPPKKHLEKIEELRHIVGSW